MKVQQGFSYHIKDDFFELVKDEYLMSNKEDGNYRPHFYAVQDKKNLDLYWMIPISSQVEKYKRIVEKKKKKFGKCNTIVIGKFAGKENAFLIQNAFPIIEKYLDHIHTIQGQPIMVHKELNKVLVRNLQDVLAMYDSGVKLMFTNVQEIRHIMEKELQDYFPIVVQVIPLSNFHVQVFFDDGKIVEYDSTNDLQGEIFKPLQDIQVFKDTCTILNDTLAWDLTGDRDASNCIDIDPFTLYELPAINDLAV